MVYGIGKTNKMYSINESVFRNIEVFQKKKNKQLELLIIGIYYFLYFLWFSRFTTDEERGIIETTNHISRFKEEYKNMENKIPIMFYMLQNDSWRLLQNK